MSFFLKKLCDAESIGVFTVLFNEFEIAVLGSYLLELNSDVKFRVDLIIDDWANAFLMITKIRSCGIGLFDNFSLSNMA